MPQCLLQLCAHPSACVSYIRLSTCLVLACAVAFTPCNRFNGGLEVLKGSHRCRQPGAASGAIEFEVKPWGQAVPTPAGVQFALDQGCEAVYADLEPGDAIFCAYPLTCPSVCLSVYLSELSV